MSRCEAIANSTGRRCEKDAVEGSSYCDIHKYRSQDGKQFIFKLATLKDKVWPVVAAAGVLIGIIAGWKTIFGREPSIQIESNFGQVAEVINNNYFLNGVEYNPISDFTIEQQDGLESIATQVSNAKSEREIPIVFPLDEKVKNISSRYALTGSWMPSEKDQCHIEFRSESDSRALAIWSFANRDKLPEGFGWAAHQPEAIIMEVGGSLYNLNRSGVWWTPDWANVTPEDGAFLLVALLRSNEAKFYEFRQGDMKPRLVTVFHNGFDAAYQKVASSCEA